MLGPLVKFHAGVAGRNSMVVCRLPLSAQGELHRRASPVKVNHVNRLDRLATTKVNHAAKTHDASKANKT